MPRSLRPVVLPLLLIASGCRPEAPPTAAPERATAAAAPAPAPPSEAPRGLPALPSASESAPVRDLVERVAALNGSGELLLPAGVYLLDPQVEIDAACAPCQREDWQSDKPPMTVGLRLQGRGIRLIGEGSDRTVIRTRSGYGVLVDGCEGCAISGVSIVDGNRDASDLATDAAIVVRESTVTIEDCVLGNNVGTQAQVEHSFVGISGLVVREGGVAALRRCRIVRNSWDGVAVMRGGRVQLRDVVIDGVDRALGKQLGGGRGNGLRIVTGGYASLDGVLVTRHAGGVALYGPSRLEVRDVVVEESPSFGVLARSDASGAPDLRADGLVVHRVGACGIDLDERVTGQLSLVRVARAAQVGRRAGPCEPLALQSPPGVELSDSLTWLTGGQPGTPGDVEAAAFRDATQDLASRLAARPATVESIFVSGAIR